MIDIIPKEVDVREVYRLMVGGIGPRPIALVSTISKGGVVNLSPFSFYNMFGANPPIVVFSPTLRGKDSTAKDTLNNLRDVPECVVQAVTHAMVEQVSLASTEYSSDVDEFVKSGLTAMKSDIVKPPRVKESPFQMECTVKQIIETGSGPIAGNLVVCEVQKIHIAKDIMTDGGIDQQKIDLVGRNGDNWYTRSHGAALFEVAKPIGRTGIGFDGLPEALKKSTVLSANNLAQLANCEAVPSETESIQFIRDFKAISFHESGFNEAELRRDVKTMLSMTKSILDHNKIRAAELLERCIVAALARRDTNTAWHVAVFLQANAE
ncbi:MAG: flavin reductase family protein [Candidatus Zixiibacteriota bacterium]